VCCSASTGAVAADDERRLVTIRGDTATFDAATNLPAVVIHGKSVALEGRAHIRRNADALLIEGLEATVPVESLNTGIELRDEHMRRYVFATADGQLPKARFVGE
jgi:hypothetical protein